MGIHMSLITLFIQLIPTDYGCGEVNPMEMNGRYIMTRIGNVLGRWDGPTSEGLALDNVAFTMMPASRNGDATGPLFSVSTGVTRSHRRARCVISELSCVSSRISTKRIVLISHVF